MGWICERMAISWVSVISFKAQNRHFPDMKKKPTQRPTARWVFFCFQGIHVLSIDNDQRHVTNLQDRHRIILKCLGDIYQQIYS